MYNRPLSPHITIYAVQESSLTSIWHRASGILLSSLIVFFFIYLQLSIHINYEQILLNYVILNKITSFFYEVFYVIIILFLCYHAFNGSKQFLWDLGFYLHLKFIRMFLIVISFFICIIIFLLIFN
uniref:SdhC n=1 Tax=Agarophyton chilense TaxID=2510777 RepID=A0A0D5Y9F6_AGACH|nr:SdhC [Agarophyton chilense]AKA27619.1 SdhC [Agarophyton chilense]ASP44547.1 succinate:cytochrome c oxidoreductase subunit C [Agarophyton chilense]UAD89528.1 succinate dehydrogenase subunit 3 [Agarophyton chilense]